MRTIEDNALLLLSTIPLSCRHKQRGDDWSIDYGNLRKWLEERDALLAGKGIRASFGSNCVHGTALDRDCDKCKRRDGPEDLEFERAKPIVPCPLHGDAWCTCRGEPEPEAEEIGRKAEAILAKLGPAGHPHGALNAVIIMMGDRLASDEHALVEGASIRYWLNLLESHRRALGPAVDRFLLAAMEWCALCQLIDDFPQPPPNLSDRRDRVEGAMHTAYLALKDRALTEPSKEGAK
jgi:hypothetical protein